MRLTDALTAMRSGKSRFMRQDPLSTIWGERLDPHHILQEYPRPQLRRQDWICLNGLWQYAITGKGDHPAHADGEILVPFSPESRASGVMRRLKPGEYLWYQRVWMLKKIPEGKRLILHFGAVDQSCMVWWNGHPAGKSESGYLPFSMDVTEYLREGKNSIRVRVRDDTEESGCSRGKQSLNPGGMFYPAQSGIWQTVWMEWVPETYLRQLKITPCFDEQTVRLELTLTRPSDIEVRLEWEGDTFVHCIKSREFRKESCRCIREIPVPAFCPWSPEHPYLYRVHISAGEDQVESYFAMRKFSVGMDEDRRPRIFLNNSPYFFNGILDQGYWPESLYTPPSDEAILADLKGAKTLGFNTIRKHVKIEPMRWYYHCDRIGLVVWQDMVNGGGRISMALTCYLPNLFPPAARMISDRCHAIFGRGGAKGEAGILQQRRRQQWEKECAQTVEQLYNCPCIGMWILFNEGWGQFDSLRIEKNIRQLDPTRLIDDASGWFDQGGGDVKSVHNYFRPLKIENDRRPFVISEYGGYVLAVPGHSREGTSYGYHAYASREELTRAWKELSDRVHTLSKEGLSGAVFTQLTDVETEINGLYTYDRKICKVMEEKPQ